MTTTNDKIADAEAKASTHLARANELSARCRFIQAGKHYDKAGYWLARANYLRGGDGSES